MLSDQEYGIQSEQDDFDITGWKPGEFLFFLCYAVSCFVFYNEIDALKYV